MGDKSHVAPLSFLEFNGRSKSNLGIGNTGTKTQSPRNFITVPTNHPSSNQRHEPFAVPSNIRLAEHQTKNRLLQSNIFRRPLPSSQPDSYAQQDHLFPIRMLGMKQNHHADNSIASEFTQNQETPSFQAHTTNSSAFLPQNTSSPASSPSPSAFSLSHSETTLVSHQTKLDKLELPFPDAQGTGISTDETPRDLTPLRSRPLTPPPQRYTQVARSHRAHVQEEEANAPSRCKSKPPTRGPYQPLAKSDEFDPVLVFTRQREDLRIQVAEQTQEIQHLKQEIEELTKRLDIAKVTARKAVEVGQKNLETLNASTQLLQVQSKEFFASIAEIRSQSSDLSMSRASVAEHLTKIESLVGQDGSLHAVTAAKALIDEFQHACTQSQQVSDLLRDKLQNVLGELAEARHRVRELEALQLEEGSAQQNYARWLAECREQTSQLAAALKAQGKELLDALTTAAELQFKLDGTTKRVTDLTSQLEERDNQLKAARTKAIALQVQLDDKNSRLAKSETVRHELSVQLNEHEVQLRLKELQIEQLNSRISEQESARQNSITIANEHEAQLRILQYQLDERNASLTILEALREELTVTLSDQKGQLDSLRALNDTSNSSLLKAEKENDDLRESLQHREAEAKADARELCVLRQQHTILQDRIGVLGGTLAQDRAAEIKAAQELQCGIAVLRNQNKNLQDRLDDSEDLQDRLEASGRQVAILEDRIRVLEETCAAKEGAKEGADKASQEFRCEIAVLQTQNKTLQARLQSEKELQDGLDVFNRRITVLQEQNLVLQTTTSNNALLLKVAEDGALRAQEECQFLKTSATGLQETISLLSCELQELKERSLSSAPNQEIANQNLMHRVEDLTNELDALRQRSANIEARSKRGELTEEEQAFVRSVMQMSKDIYEKDIVDKGNELRRRDNTIKQQAARIISLEASLARQLKVEAKAAVGETTKSMMDFQQSAQSTSVTIHKEDETFAIQSNDETGQVEVQVTVSAEPVQQGPSLGAVQEGDRLSFAALDSGLDEIADFDDLPVEFSALGKRERTSSPNAAGPSKDHRRPGRRVRAGNQQAAPESVGPTEQSAELKKPQKGPDIASKAKTRRRRVK